VIVIFIVVAVTSIVVPITTFAETATADLGTYGILDFPGVSTGNRDVMINVYVDDFCVFSDEVHLKDSDDPVSYSYQYTGNCQFEKISSAYDDTVQYESKNMDGSMPLGLKSKSNSYNDRAINIYLKTVTTKFSVRYDKNGGEGVMNDSTGPYAYNAKATVLPNEFTAPTGHGFSGWNTESDGTGTAYAPGEVFVVSEDTTLYAQWNPSAVAVLFCNNFSNDDNSTYSAGMTANPAPEYNGKLNAFSAPARTGYTFHGWWTDRVGGTEWNFEANVVNTESAFSLYALWTENSSYSVFYDMNGATSKAVAPKTNVCWTQTALLPADPARTGCLFKGWNVVSGGKETNVSAVTAYGSLVSNESIQSITLQAQWEPQEGDASGASSGANTSDSSGIAADSGGDVNPASTETSGPTVLSVTSASNSSGTVSGAGTAPGPDAANAMVTSAAAANMQGNATGSKTTRTSTNSDSEIVGSGVPLSAKTLGNDTESEGEVAIIRTEAPKTVESSSDNGSIRYLIYTFVIVFFALLALCFVRNRAKTRHESTSEYEYKYE
jgi:uncharacterized repeat protein (TIGR02543 family)